MCAGGVSQLLAQQKRATQASPLQVQKPLGNSGRELRFNMGKLLGDFRIVFDVVIDGPDGVKHGGVVTSPEIAPDFLEAVSRVPPRQVHADLPGEGDRLMSFL